MNYVTPHHDWINGENTVGSKSITPIINLYSASSNLGDNLSLTPMMRLTECRVHLIDDPAVREIAPLFDGLGEVVFDNDSRASSPQNTYFSGPHSARYIRAHVRSLAGESINAIPSINLTPDEISWARTFLSDFDLSKTCVVKASTSQVNYRTPPDGLLASIIEANPDTTFFTSVLSTNHVKNNFHNVEVKAYKLVDFPIRKMAALYHIIGRYVGPDSGDYHLMLAVGGKADVLVPPSEWHYDHSHFHYRPEDFVGEAPRARYHLWTQPFAPSICGLNLTSIP